MAGSAIPASRPFPPPGLHPAAETAGVAPRNGNGAGFRPEWQHCPHCEHSPGARPPSLATVRIGGPRCRNCPISRTKAMNRTYLADFRVNQERMHCNPTRTGCNEPTSRSSTPSQFSPSFCSHDFVSSQRLIPLTKAGQYLGNYILWCPKQRSDPHDTQGTGQAPPRGHRPRPAVRYVSRRRGRRGMGHGTTPAAAPSLWNRPRPAGSDAHDDALPLPRA